jgi:hypothetical protein
MSNIESSLRAFWLPGLNAVSGKVFKGLGGWIADEEYQIFSPLRQDSFTLSLSAPDQLLFAIAADVNRCAIASFESINAVNKSNVLPRSTAWLVIKSYYAAFFGAHAIARMLGIGFLQFERTHANSVNKIADLFEMSNNVTVLRGYYAYNYDAEKKQIIFNRVKAESGGVHEIFWGIFYSLIRKLSDEVISSVTSSPANNHQVSAKLNELAANLSHGSMARGNWLSTIRNSVNYSHRLGAWFPYAEQRSHFATLYNNRDKWLNDPMSIDLTSHADSDLLRFQATCSFIISLCRVLVSDMAARNSGKKSFHEYGSIALLNLTGHGKHRVVA